MVSHINIDRKDFFSEQLSQKGLQVKRDAVQSIILCCNNKKFGCNLEKKIKKKVCFLNWYRSFRDVDKEYKRTRKQNQSYLWG